MAMIVRTVVLFQLFFFLAACAQQHPSNGTTDKQLVTNPPIRGRFVQEEEDGPGVIECDALVSNFTMDYDTRMTNQEASTLCSCVNERYAVKGWEPGVIRAGSSDWRFRAAIHRVGQAIKSCSADYNIY